MFTCELCKKDFNSLQGFCGHKAFCGKETKKFCDICKKEVSCYMYSRHVKAHKKDGKCPCGNPIHFPQKYCSHSCAAKKTNIGRTRPRGNCVSCNKPLPKNTKRFCSHQCQLSFKHEQYIEHWLKGEISGNNCNGLSTSNYIKRWLIKQRGEKCEECGWNKRNPYSGKIPIQIEHVDGNSANTRPENLKLLCPSCHSLTPTFGGLNRGKGRKSRYNKK